MIFDTDNRKNPMHWMECSNHTDQTMQVYVNNCITNNSFIFYYSYIKNHINSFGAGKHIPIPPSCLISVYTTGIPNTVPVLHYGIPLEGVDPPVTVYIHRSMRTPTSTGNIVITLSHINYTVYIRCSIRIYYSIIIPTISQSTIINH